MIKYRTGGYGKNLIEEVECERETEKSVWAKRVYGSGFERCLKETEYHNYHDTWEKAHEYLIEKAERQADGLRRQLQLANSYLGNIKGLKNKTGE